MRRLIALCLTCFEAFLLVAFAYGITLRGPSTGRGASAAPKQWHRTATKDHAMALACSATKPVAPFSCETSIGRSAPASRSIVRFAPGSGFRESVSYQENQRNGKSRKFKAEQQSERTASKLLDPAGFLDKLLASLGALAPAGLAIAVLAFGKSLHFIETTVERAFERLVLRRSLRMRRNLKSLLADCKRIGNAEDLLRVCADQLRPLTGAHRIAFYELCDGGYVPTCSDSASAGAADHGFVALHRDDQAMLRITAQRGPVEAAGLATALPPKSVAFPMLSAGRLVGAVVCEGQSASFAPGERQLIADFVHDLGAALVFLRSAYHSPAALTEHAVYDLSHIWSHSRSATRSEAPQPA